MSRNGPSFTDARAFLSKGAPNSLDDVYDLYAAAALSGLVARSEADHIPEVYAKHAHQIARSMMKHRTPPSKGPQ